MNEDGQFCQARPPGVEGSLRVTTYFQGTGRGSKIKVKERSKARVRLQTSPCVALSKVQSLELAGEKAGPGPGVQVGEAPEGPEGASSNACRSQATEFMIEAAFTDTGMDFTQFPERFYNSCHTKGIFMVKGLLAHVSILLP